MSQKSVMQSILEGLHDSRIRNVIDNITEGVAKSSDALEDFMYHKAKKGMKFTFIRDYRYGHIYDEDGYEIDRMTGESRYKLRCVYADKKNNSYEWVIPRGTVATFMRVEGGPGRCVVFNINGLEVDFMFFNSEEGDGIYLSSKDFPEDVLEGRKVVCPKCGSTDVIVREDKSYYCKECGLVFTDKDLRVNEKMQRMDSYEVKRDGVTYEVAFYQDTTTGESTTQITKVVNYDLEDYHYAISSDGQNFKLCRNGKVVKKIKLRFEEMSMGDVNMLVDELIALDKKAKLTPRIDRT